MIFKIATLLIICFQGVLCQSSPELESSLFNSSFSFGVGTSSYQIEGAWNVSGKGLNFWDWATHTLPFVADGSNGDVACDSYHKLDEDIALLKALGVNHYRFSVSWTRILPTGYTNVVNEDGVRYYNELIDKLLANNIEPWLTIYHWDTPYTTFVIGGWLQEETSLQLAQFADLLFQLYGDRVKVWITINEPYNICNSGLGFIKGRPLGISEYICGRNILRAHALIIDIYNKKYRDIQNGKLSMAFSMQGLLPASESAEDQAAVARVSDFMWGWFVHPVIYGDYPEVMRQEIGRYSKVQGFNSSRLVPLSCKEKRLLRGSVDFIGINSYETWLVQANDVIDNKQSYQNDLGANINTEPAWNISYRREMSAKGFGLILKYIKDNYNNIEIRITEQGMSDKPDVFDDYGRHNYLILCLNQLLKSISEGVNVTGYTFWSLMDNFEWAFGYTARFGLYHVNFTDPARPRTPKISAGTFTKIVKQKSISGLNLYDI